VNRTLIRSIVFISAVLISRGIGFAEDTELRDLDLNHWSCLNKPAGTPTHRGERERNFMKNRGPVRALPSELEHLDVNSFLKKVAACHASRTS